MTPALTLTLILAPLTPAIPTSEIPPAEHVNALVEAPASWERYRFPPSAVCEAALTFNRRFVRNLEAERDIWPEDRQAVFDAAIEEADLLHECWTALAWAQWEPAQPWNARADWRRRLDLRKFRDLIGPAAFAAGEWPAVIPSWRCRSIP